MALDRPELTAGLLWFCSDFENSIWDATWWVTLNQSPAGCSWIKLAQEVGLGQVWPLPGAGSLQTLRFLPLFLWPFLVLAGAAPPSPLDPASL